MTAPTLYRATYETHAAPGFRRVTFAATPAEALPVAADWALSDYLLRIDEVRPLQPQFTLT